MASGLHIMDEFALCDGIMTRVEQMLVDISMEVVFSYECRW